MEPNTLKMPHTFRAAAVGACIYCGVRAQPLSEEHVIPKGLGGTLVLPSASCATCAMLTSQFEMRVLRGFMDKGRQALGIKSRKSHKRAYEATNAQALIQADGTIQRFDVPTEESIRVLHLPVLALPYFLDHDRPPTPETKHINVDAIETLTFGLDNSDLIGRNQAVGARFEDEVDLWAFVRMLAKIAHGYHVAMRGVFPMEESPLVPIIMGERVDAQNWVGCTKQQDALPDGRSALHLLQEDVLTGADGSKCSTVRIKLFAGQPTCTYVLATRLTLAEPQNA
ncbi:HNH endonuclease [Lysobacter enzymogenes]|uniref:HNH endonuclease n=1 Tax=Lysobacter enzymogenes TaxID=69 RepID=UPI001A966B5D|nr:HNH endonuclease [Lysobacter enzymogenes]QQP97962.1 hypothetical protein JHW38_08150 [Lysobacter enzymogenes]